MKKILVILTGGTIGSKISLKDINVDSNAAYSLISRYQECYEKETEFEVLSPYKVLSENMDLEYWMKLYETLCGISYSDYEGVIITHGSDTLAYTSNFIGYLFGKTPIPMILIASNYALTHPKSNGLLNFKTSIDFIKEKKGKGVFTIFSNHKDEVPVYRATNVNDADPYLDRFSPFDGTYYDVKKGDYWLSELEKEEGLQEKKNTLEETNIEEVQIEETKIDEAQIEETKIEKTEIRETKIEEIKIGEITKAEETRNYILFENQLKLKKRVLGIRVYPGLDFDVYDLSKVNVVLCYLYHSATASVEGNNTSILNFIHKCKEKGIQVFVASFKSGEAGGYVTKQEILKAGAIPLYDLSYESAYMKLLIGINQTQTDLCRWMKEIS